MEDPPPIRRSQPIDPRKMQLPRATSSWPKIMAIIGIIVSVLGILNALGNVAYLGVMKAIGFERYFEFMMTGMENDPSFQDGEEFTEAFSAMGTFLDSMFPSLIVMGLLVLALAIVLLITCLKLIKRNRKARRMMIIWAYAAIAVGLISSFLTHRMNSKMMGEMFSNLDLGPEVSMINTLVTVFTIIGALAVMIVPIFLLIWFNRQTIKEEVSGETWIS